MMFRRERWTNRLLVALAAWLFVPCANAQQFSLPMTLGESLKPDYYRRDLSALGEELRLDDEQRVVIDSLFSDYETEFREKADQTRQQLQAIIPLAALDSEVRAMKEEQIRARVAQLVEQVQQMRTDVPAGEEGEAIRREIQERAATIRNELAAINSEQITGEQLREAMLQADSVLSAWQTEKDRMRTAFDSGVQAVVTEEQRERWPNFERRMRREKSLPRGRLSGESVNIDLIVKQLKLSPETYALISSDLGHYQARLDEALKARDDRLTRANLELINVMHDESREKAEAIATQITRLRLAVRDVNDDAARTIGAALPAEDSSRFMTAWQEQAYSRVFRTTSTLRLLNAASEIPDLDPAMVDAINSLKASYLLELTPVSNRLLEAIRAAEPVEMQARIVRSAVGGEEDWTPEVEAMETESDRRLVLGKRFEAQLEALLGEDYWQKLPYRPSESEDADD